MPLDPTKVDSYVVLTHLVLRVFLTLAFTLAFFIVLAFLLWKPTVYLAVVGAVLAPTTFLMAQFFFPVNVRKRQQKKTG